MTRIFFSTDVHGSTHVWKKWLSVPKVHKANVLALSGDLVAKVTVPILEKGDGTWTCKYWGREWTMHNESEVQEMMERLDYTGAYYFRCNGKELEELQKDQRKLSQLWDKLVGERMKLWMDLIVENVNTKDVLTFVMPGNDDPHLIDGIIKGYEDRGIVYPLDRVVELPPGYEMISLDHVNPTPWNTEREMEEPQLEEKIKKLVDMLKEPGKSIWNFHPPPYNTHLDLAPKLDKNLKPVTVLGNPIKIHVGSKAVRKMIERSQPLIGLHGHIHESFASDKINKTVVVNPGSEYSEGILRGFIVDIDGDGVKNYWKVEG